MAVKVSIASGNWTTAGTWGVVDSTSYLNAENATESSLTTSYANTRSSAFTPGAITISHIGVKLCERNGTTGTMSVNLELDSDNSQVAGTEVTINVADLQAATEANLNGGWILFKLAAPVTLIAATAYQIAAKTSSTSQVDLWCDGTVDNLSRVLVTTTTGAPAAGDDLIVTGEYTGAGTSNTFTVTMDETATTDYGSASTSLVTPALAICSKGVLTWGTTAATNYNLKLSGNLIIYAGGTYNQGTTGTPCPRDSTMTLQFDCGANVDFGLTVRVLGTYVSQGLAFTSGKDIVQCKLNTDEAVNSTSLGVDTDTGWPDNAEIAIASTTRTVAECENGTLNGNAGASTLTVDGFAGAGGGLAFAHLGTSPIQAEVILLTRNVRVIGVSSTLQTFVDIKAGAFVDLDWTEFKWLGSATTNKRGIDIGTTVVGTFTANFCSIHQGVVASSTGFNVAATANTSSITIADCTTYNINSEHVSIAATTGVHTLSDITCIRSVSTGSAMFIADDSGSVYTNIVVVGCGGTSNAAGGITLRESTSGIMGTFSNITVHTCAGNGITFSGTKNFTSGTFSNIKSYRNNGVGVDFSQALVFTNTVFDGIEVFGNTIRNIAFGGGSPQILYNCIFKNVVSNNDSGATVTTGLSFGVTGNNYCFINCKMVDSNFSTASGIKTAHSSDIVVNSGFTGDFNIYNTTLAAGTEINLPTNLLNGGMIGLHKHEGVAGDNRSIQRYGTISRSTAEVRTGTTSMLMTPNNASFKLNSIGPTGGFKVQVDSGGTVTPSVYVFENAAYNGNRARLLVRRNDVLGITADTVLATATAASDLAWEELTGTTAAVTDDGVLEFYVDCDGTAGGIHVEDFSATY